MLPDTDINFVVGWNDPGCLPNPDNVSSYETWAEAKEVMLEEIAQYDDDVPEADEAQAAYDDLCESDGPVWSSEIGTYRYWIELHPPT